MKTRDENGNGRNPSVIAGLLLGDSQVMRSLRSLLARLGPSQSPVLIEGPTGSGKELVAEALHVCSRRPGAFVAFNVCAIGDGMFESALFGHVRGAFTGSVQDAAGYLSEADRGTVFLDEIGSLTLSAQAKLLRAIETRSYRPVGGRRDVTSDFRVLAASNNNLAAAVTEGRFRADLFHRLRAMVIRVPALVDHIEDVPLLARYFARLSGSAADACLSEGAIRRLMEHDWPGNVRELRNVVEFALALGDGARVGAAEIGEALGTSSSGFALPRLGWTRPYVTGVLADCGGDTERVAKRLGLDRSTVYRLMRRLGIGTPKRRRHALVIETPHVSPCTPDSDPLALFAIEDGYLRGAPANSEDRSTRTSD